jgi:hypothetical protein
MAARNALSRAEFEIALSALVNSPAVAPAEVFSLVAAYPNLLGSLESRDRAVTFLMPLVLAQNREGVANLANNGANLDELGDALLSAALELFDTTTTISVADNWARAVAMVGWFAQTFGRLLPRDLRGRYLDFAARALQKRQRTYTAPNWLGEVSPYVEIISPNDYLAFLVPAVIRLGLSREQHERFLRALLELLQPGQTKFPYLAEQVAPSMILICPEEDLGKFVPVPGKMSHMASRVRHAMTKVEKRLPCDEARRRYPLLAVLKRDVAWDERMWHIIPLEPLPRGAAFSKLDSDEEALQAFARFLSIYAQTYGFDALARAADPHQRLVLDLVGAYRRLAPEQRRL